MGTRGLYAYKWRGRYYVYYNHYDSYPTGLGLELSGEVPTDPGAYKEWLERVRSRYQRLSEELDQKYMSVTIEKIMDGKMRLFDEEKPSGLENVPSFVAPCNDVFIEYVYIFDLDDERFSCNKCYYFKLGKISQDWIEWDSDILFFGDELKEDQVVHESVTTPALQRMPLGYDPTDQYKKLNANVISPRSLSTIPDKFANKPATQMCLKLFNTLLKGKKTDICEARDQNRESDFLFREISFELLSLASCSNKLVRFFSAKDVITETNWDYLILNHGEDATKQYEFVTKSALGYHLEGLEPGSAPKSTSYWIEGVLTVLKRDVDITSVDGYKDAILTAVAKGKVDGRTLFDAIIFSIKRIIIVRVNGDQVQHTKCLSCVDKLAVVFNRYESGGPAPTNKVLAVLKPEDEGLIDSTVSPTHAFYLMALVFEGAQLRELRPSSAHRHGVFPNEVYANILKHIESKARNACLKVSRAFRDYASEVLPLDDRVQLEHQAIPGNTDTELTGQFQMHATYHNSDEFGYLWNFNREHNEESKYVPVIGYANDTAFYEPNLEVSIWEIPRRKFR